MSRRPDPWEPPASATPFDGGPAIEPEALRRLAAAIAGPIAAVALSGGLVAARDTIGVGNIAFLMVAVVVATSSLTGRYAGQVTAISAALAFNYFHTQPFLSFAIAARQDAVSVVVLALVGTVAGELAHRHAAARATWRRTVESQADVDRALRTLADGAPFDEVWHDASVALSNAGCVRCSFVPAGAPVEETVDARTYVVPVGRVVPVGHLLVTVRGRLEPSTGALARRLADVLAAGAAAGGHRPTAPG